MAASWQEISRLKKDPAAFRTLAKRLLNLDVELTDWERTFLESVCDGPDYQKFTARQTEVLLQLRDQKVSAAEAKKAKKLHDEKEYSLRQSEKLLQIRNDYEIITNFHGFSVGFLLKGCYEARLELVGESGSADYKTVQQKPNVGEAEGHRLPNALRTPAVRYRGRTCRLDGACSSPICQRPRFSVS